MSSLAAWISVDSRSPSALYIIADSRITLSNSKKWDYGRKVFNSTKYPHVFGYCGDAFFPPMILSQIVSLIDSGVVFCTSDNAHTKHSKIVSLIQNSLSGYSFFTHSIYFLHSYREGKGLNAEFFTWLVEIKNSKIVKDEQLPHPQKSGLVIILGSGDKTVKNKMNKFDKSDAGGTSRAVFYAIYDAVKSANDPNTGGALQMVTLVREGPASVVGFIDNNLRYVLGIPLLAGNSHHDIKYDNIEWRNSNFELCDGTTMIKKKKAQRQVKPIIK